MQISLISADQADYLLFLEQVGMTQDDIERLMATAGRVVPFEREQPRLRLHPSERHGLGLFTTKDIKDGELICVALDQRGRTVAARYTNHSKIPNAKFIRTGDDRLLLYATREIGADQEILIDYREAYRVSTGITVPVMPPVGVAPFTRGDAYGEDRRAVAVAESRAQLPIMPEGSIRAKLFKLQESITSLPDVEMPLQHTFAPGVYVRTIFIPAGCVLVGKIHKHEHANILSQGHVEVLTENGGREELRGPLVMVSKPGTKRAVYAHTDTVWTTIHPTDKTDLAEIEEETISPTYADYEQFRLQQGEH